MKNLLNIRHLLLAFVFGLCLMPACKEKSGGKLSTDLVTSPK